MEDLVPLLLEHGATLVFLVTLAARVGAPVPAAPLLVVAGALCALGQIPLGTTVASSLLANMLGDVAWFAAGRSHGHRVLGLLCRLSLSPDSCVRQSEDLFGRWGGLSLVAAKFVPGVSLIAAPMAGALRMKWMRFLSWNFLAALVWTATFMAIGSLFKSEINRVLSMLADAGVKALLALALLFAVVVTFRWLRKARAASLTAGMLVSAEQLVQELARGDQLVFLDVRGPVSREATGTVPGAVAAELSRVEHAVQDVPRDASIVTYCNCPNELSAVMAANTLLAGGFQNVRVLAGGFDAWSGLARS